MKNVIRPHPLAEAIPAMSEVEYNELRDHIKAHGLNEPIVVFEGLILDGRHRYKACGELHIKEKIKNFAGDANAALAYVIGVNLKRRNLTKGQRAAAAAKLATMRQGERTDLEPSANLPKVSQADAAAAMQVSERAVGQVKEIEREAPELIDEIKAGTLTVNKASKIAKERKATTKKTPKAKAEPKRVSVKVLVDDYRQRIARDILTLEGKDRGEFLKRVNAILNQFVGELRDQELMPLDEGTKAVAGIFAAAMDPSNAGELERSISAAASKEATDDRLH